MKLVNCLFILAAAILILPIAIAMLGSLAVPAYLALTGDGTWFEKIFGVAISTFLYTGIILMYFGTKDNCI